MNKSILLSICIPTFNRSTYLDKTLDSITCQSIFINSDDVEIIISDNNSNDETRNVSLKYVAKYPGKVCYYKNEENIGDLNFEKSLSYGKGIFLKLNNDTLTHELNSLSRMIEIIHENLYDKKPIFFMNQNLNILNGVTCTGMDLLIMQTSFWIGWIGGFGIWKIDFKLKDFRTNQNSKLAQINVIFKLIESKKIIIVNNEKLFQLNAPAKKGGYDLLNVFLDEYLEILHTQVRNNNLSINTFNVEKRKVLLKLILPWLVESKLKSENFSFTSQNKWERIFRTYKNDYISILLFIFKYRLSIFYSRIKSIINFKPI